MNTFATLWCITLFVVMVLFLLPHIATFVYLRKHPRKSKDKEKK